jgi:NTP pyrophosphatase (non-canonical NTP hydrolase)
MIDDLIKQWGRDRGINNPDKQTVKLMEEVGELAREICRGKYDSDELKDAFGDIQVVLIILGDMLGIDTEKCKEEAYNVIKDRTGHNVDGSFVKDGE